MPVRKTSAKEILGGKALVITANPSHVGIKKLQQGGGKGLSSVAIPPSEEEDAER